MASTDKFFDIVLLTADSQMYYPASLGRPGWFDRRIQLGPFPDRFVKHTEIDIPLGHSRYGGPVIDVPEGFEMPKGPVRFACQLDLAALAPHDAHQLLPKQGQLYFFADIRTDTGRVIYVDVPNESLHRIIIEHEDHFFLGVLVKDMSPAVESLSERFCDPSDWEYERINDNGKAWDSFAGSDKSKIFGIPTDCQRDQAEIEEIIDSGKLVLLQIGENGFSWEGVFSVLIPKEDLQRRVFERCEIRWGQS